MARTKFEIDFFSTSEPIWRMWHNKKKKVWEGVKIGEAGIFLVYCESDRITVEAVIHGMHFIHTRDNYHPKSESGIKRVATNMIADIFNYYHALE